MESRNRRRSQRAQSPIESSSDELAAGSEHDEAERRRASWTAQKVFTPQRSHHRKRPYQESDSPDELAVDADDYWRSSRPDETRSPSPVNRPDEIEGQSDDNMGGRAMNSEEGHAEDKTLDRSATPVPPPPPPKPERLNYKEKFVLKRHLRGVSAVQFSPDCSMIASGGADRTVKVWDTLTGKLLFNFEGHLAGVSAIAWNPDNTLASGSDDKTIRLWDVSTGRAHPRPLVGHHNYVYQIAFSPKGNILVSGSYDEAVFIWDVRSGRVMKSLPAHSDPVNGVDFIRDGTMVVSCATDGLIRVWDTASGQCLRTLVHEDNPPVTCVKFSPNGKYVLAWTLDNCVRLWDYRESRCIKTYQGHVNIKYSLGGGFGRYGLPGAMEDAFVVSGSEDGAVICWDLVSKKILQRIEGHTDVVLGVHTGTLAGKRLIVSAGLDKTIRVWEEVSEDDTEMARSTTNGNGDSPDNDADGDNAMTDAPLSAAAADTPIDDAMEA
ncbi:hypothetical protein N7510_008479 [Penicillium lagena]|uniref:uncharacterized protein n=1 Tax=Penicillium lagena TaxID=94218 RepID=UPI00253FB728|nr:uncharacterized protein N7510_008479 [Penicillium lagena]KAJ5605698.1 hypothetical protein N7510_008479 [Penicillium lagena]